MSFVVGPWESFGSEIIYGISSHFAANKESFKSSKAQVFTEGMFKIFSD